MNDWNHPVVCMISDEGYVRDVGLLDDETQSEMRLE